VKYDTLNKLESITLKWSHDRGILTNGKAATQGLKLTSEAGELVNNINIGGDVKDDIGDNLVVLTNLANLKGTSLAECGLNELMMYDNEPNEREVVLGYFVNLGNLCDNIGKSKDIKKDIFMYLQSLQQIAFYYEVNLVECWNIAYDDIKDRQGFLNEHGNFIKSTDDNYKQLLMEFEESLKDAEEHN